MADDLRPLDFPPAPGALDRSLSVVRFLREHCDWDRKQTAESLVPYLLEEAGEVAEAIRLGHADALVDELGDLLLNVAFQVVVAEESGLFGAEEVARALEAKMKRRHPHLFRGGTHASWREIKAVEAQARREGHDTTMEGHGASSASPVPESASASGSEAPALPGREGPSILGDIPENLDALGRAHALQTRAAQIGFDWPDAGGAWAKIQEELEEVSSALADGSASQVREELGDLLFSVVNLSRLLSVHPTEALSEASRKFERRFRSMEGEAARSGLALEERSLEELDALWERAKTAEKPGLDGGKPASGGVDVAR